MPIAQTAQANVDVPMPIVEPAIGPNTEITLTTTGPGQTIPGFEPEVVAPQDPLTPYPAADPATGYQSHTTFAGTIITSSVSDPTLRAEMYCINLRVGTSSGLGYESGTWAESNVLNIGYVTFILNNYYPTTDQPAGLAANQRAAAVQAAIWYFTDSFLVSTSSPVVRAAAAAIVATAQANGPVAEPPAPDVTVTPPTSSAPIGASAGPFTVAAENAASLTISVPAGHSMFADEAASTPLSNPAVVESGTDVWVRNTSATEEPAVLRARAVVTVQRGEVYLYDGNTPGLEDAQRLILANTTELDAVADATAEFFAVGTLTVNKSFAGAAAGEQDASELDIDCGAPYVFTAEIPAGVDETQTFTYPDIPAGTTCVVTEPLSGETTAVTVTSDAPQDATVTTEGASIDIVNTVEYRPGALTVTKVVTGSAAGRQGDIVLSIICDELLDQEIVIPAGAEGGAYQQTYSELPAGTSCTVTETATGATAAVEIDAGDPVTVSIEPGATVEAVITNTVDAVTPPGPVNPARPAAPAAGAPDPAGLASTGADSPLPASLVALGLVAVGAAALLAIRARRRRGSAPRS
jgi:TQXA domain-containing protein